jgi:hypothetical protein
MLASIYTHKIHAVICRHRSVFDSEASIATKVLKLIISGGARCLPNNRSIVMRSNGDEETPTLYSSSLLQRRTYLFQMGKTVQGSDQSEVYGLVPLRNDQPQLAHRLGLFQNNLIQ